MGHPSPALTATAEGPLAAEPAVLTGALIGYARVSTTGQKLDAQIGALQDAGCIRIFTDKLSGKTTDRPELTACLDYLRPGDTLVVPRLDRLGRSLQDLITIVAGLRRAGVGFQSLHEALDTTTPGGRLVFHVFAALAEFIRELIVDGTREGLAAARARGQRLGRPPAMTPEQIRHARDLLTRPNNTVASIARLLGVSRSTIYKYVPELGTGRPQALEPATPAAVESRPVPQPPAVAPASSRDRLACPGCGHRPTRRRELPQHRLDLAMTWLYTDPAGHVLERRHCAACQPHDHVGAVECAICGDGCMLAGELAKQTAEQTSPSEALRHWLEEHGWHQNDQLGLICPNHGTSP